MNTKQRQREIDRAGWRLFKQALRHQHDDSWFWVNVLIVLALYWLAHCV